MTSRPRNRIVVFRLTQDEYRTLKEACDRRGARNMSDFTRSEVLDYLQSGTFGVSLNQRFAAIEQKIDVLQAQLVDLLRGGVSYAAHKPL